MFQKFWVGGLLVLAVGFGLVSVLVSDAGTADGITNPGPPIEGLETATLAGGCFWCVESAFDGYPGVVEAVSGYTGGSEPDPKYEEVSSGRSGHVEAVRIRYDPTTVSYEQLLDLFWRQIDPTDPAGQFADRGSQYRTYVYPHDESQREIAERSRRALGRSGRFSDPIVTEIVDAGTFYPAEEYHQDYAIKHPAHYKRYRYASGRTPFLEKTWGSAKTAPASTATDRPDDAELRRRLTPLQYEVTQRDGTERAFANEYWNNKAEGIYVDVVSGEPLFSSTEKFDSGTGWPSFTRPIDDASIVQKVDRKLLSSRTEIRSRKADSHLGHLFGDGPPPTGLRYCINSASLRFVPKSELEQEDLGELLRLFDEN